MERRVAANAVGIERDRSMPSLRSQVDQNEFVALHTARRVSRAGLLLVEYGDDSVYNNVHRIQYKQTPSPCPPPQVLRASSRRAIGRTRAFCIGANRPRQSC